MGGTPRLDFVALLLTWPEKLGYWWAPSSLSLFPCILSLLLPPFLRN